MLTEARMDQAGKRGRRQRGIFKLNEVHRAMIRLLVDQPHLTRAQLAAAVHRRNLGWITEVRNSPIFQRELTARRKERDDLARAAWERATEREIERRIREGESRRARAQVMNYKRRGKDGRYTKLNGPPAKRAAWPQPGLVPQRSQGGLFAQAGARDELARQRRRDREDR